MNSFAPLQGKVWSKVEMLCGSVVNDPVQSCGQPHLGRHPSENRVVAMLEFPLEGMQHCIVKLLSVWSLEGLHSDHIRLREDVGGDFGSV